MNVCKSAPSYVSHFLHRVLLLVISTAVMCSMLMEPVSLCKRSMHSALCSVWQMA